MRSTPIAVALCLALAGCAAESKAPAAAPAVEVVAGAIELGNTLERLRAMQRGRSAKPTEALDTLEDVTHLLSDAERTAIAERLRACHTRDSGAPPEDPVRLVAGFDATGRMREVALADPTDANAASPRRLAWIGRAVRTVVSPACNPIPLPPGVLGRPGRINLRFSP